MFGNDVEMSLILRRIMGPFVLGLAPNHFVLGAQLAPGEKRLVCIPVCVCACWSEPLLVAHTTLLEISCRGSWTSLLLFREMFDLLYLIDFALEPRARV